jgi:hypothetical protein
MNSQLPHLVPLGFTTNWIRSTLLDRSFVVGDQAERCDGNVPFASRLMAGALAAWCERRIRFTVVQRPQHGNAGHHNNAALFGGRDQAFHGNLPMLALGFGRWQRKDINAGVAEGSEFATVAGRNRIKKMAGPTCLPAERAWQITLLTGFQNKAAARSLLPAAKSWERACRPRICL